MNDSSDRSRHGHLVLVGLPGAGKSTIGKLVAKALGWPFLDFDVELERRMGKSIARQFSEFGEAAFRAREVALTRELVTAPSTVLAPGGGWITSPEVVDLVRPPGQIVHLRISTATALRRVSRARVVRPLLKTSDPKASMEALWERREALYNQADLTINVEVVDSQRVVKQIVALAARDSMRIG